MDYSLVGKQVRVLLYTAEGVALGVIEGRVADVASKVDVGSGIRKDLVYVVDIDVPGSDEPYRNSSGLENEGWFAVQDIELIDDEDRHGWSSN